MTRIQISIMVNLFLICLKLTRITLRCSVTLYCSRKAIALRYYGVVHVLHHAVIIGTFFVKNHNFVWRIRLFRHNILTFAPLFGIILVWVSDLTYPVFYHF